MRNGDGRLSTGITLVEVMIAVVMLGLVVTLGSVALRDFRGALALDRATGAVRGALGHARSVAVRERAVVRLRLSDEGELLLFGPDEEVFHRVVLRSGSARVDSVDLRPSTLRFNSRGQAAPGSIYLYRDTRGVRIVSNFLGRLREERFRIMQ